MPRRVPAMPGTPDSTLPGVSSQHHHGCPFAPVISCRSSSAVPPAPPGQRSRAQGRWPLARARVTGVDSLMTEDPRQTRRNGSDPRTAQSRSARSGGGSSRHVPSRKKFALKRTPSASAGAASAAGLTARRQPGPPSARHTARTAAASAAAWDRPAVAAAARRCHIHDNPSRARRGTWSHLSTGGLGVPEGYRARDGLRRRRSRARWLSVVFALNAASRAWSARDPRPGSKPIWRAKVAPS